MSASTAFARQCLPQGAQRMEDALFFMIPTSELLVMKPYDAPP